MTADIEQAEAKLRVELATVDLPLTDEGRATLQPVVCAFVDCCKADGWYPETVLVEVKRIAKDAGHSPHDRIPTIAGSAVHLHPTDEMLSELVAWCIARYYGDEAL